jgi:hypothetical protein
MMQAEKPPKQNTKSKPTSKSRSKMAEEDEEYERWKAEREMQRVRNMPGYVEVGELQSHKQYASLGYGVVNSDLTYTANSNFTAQSSFPQLCQQDEGVTFAELGEIPASNLQASLPVTLVNPNTSSHVRTYNIEIGLEADDDDEEEEPDEDPLDRSNDPTQQTVLSVASTRKGVPVDRTQEEGRNTLENPQHIKAQQYWKDHRQSTQVLLAMAIGLKAEDGRLLADLDNEPWVSIKQKNYLPTNPQLREEMQRRAPEYNKGTLRNKCLLKPKCIEWLIKFPIKDCTDRAFVMKEEARLFNEVMEMNKEKPVQAQEPTTSSSWNTKEPFLRLIMCMCHDRARAAMRYKDDTMDRSALDARRSDERPKTWEEVIADLFNDDELVFTTEAFPELHLSFAFSFDLYFNDMPGGEITADDVKARIATMRAELIQVNVLSIETFKLLLVLVANHYPNRLFTLGRKVEMDSACVRLKTRHGDATHRSTETCKMETIAALSWTSLGQTRRKIKNTCCIFGP